MALRRASDKSGDAESSEAQVLRLQSQAGNRAVASLLTGQGGPQVQREIPSAENLAFGQAQGKTVALKVDGGYAKIVKAVRKYHDATEIKKKLKYAETVAGLCRYWLEKNDGKADEQQAMQRRNIENDVEPEAKKATYVLRAQIAYEKALEKDAEQGGFHLSSSARTGALEPARKVQAGKLPDPKKPAHKGTGQETIDLVAEFGLTSGEVAAIRVYTMSDYIYINAAMAGTEKETIIPEGEGRESELVAGGHRAKKKNEKLVEERIAQAKDPSLKGQNPKLLAAEGAAHAGMVVSALSKLPKYDDPVYRGMRLSHSEFGDYFGTRITSRPQFSSASKEQAVAQSYANGTGGDVRPRPDQTVSVICKIFTDNARDVEKLSAAMKNEKEVLFFPGAKFLIIDVSSEDTGPAGTDSAPATNWLNVTMVELPPH